VEAAVPAWWHWIAVGLKTSAAMVWMTWWPLALGFCLAGLVQSLVTRDGLRARLGSTNAATVAEASALGALSSSCSYAASAMARALFTRGASWTNSLVFMVASTNLVVELGVVLWIVLGGSFLLAQLVGGVVMIAILAVGSRVAFGRRRVAALRERVARDDPPRERAGASTGRDRLRSRQSYIDAARYTRGDLTMVRKELLAGFIFAGFLSAHVPASWWHRAFWDGHGALTVAENVVVAPLLAGLSCVCSVGNIPLAATLWAHGVAFGGVIAFIFADLITLPLLAIYRRFYGAASAARLFVLLWITMSLGGAVVDAVFHAAGLVPASRHVRVLNGQFPLGATLAANVAATVLLALVWWLSRAGATHSLATDPVCGMSVDPTTAPATLVVGGATLYFCSPRCRDRYQRPPADEPAVPRREDALHDADLGPSTPPGAIDPVCGMSVDPATSLGAVGPDHVTYYFCAEGCRASFLAEHPNVEPTDRVTP
jgi:YHS domain-containing protein